MRILIIKLTSLGDIVHTLPVIADCRHYWPNAQIDWAVDTSVANVLEKVEPPLKRIIAIPLRSCFKKHTKLADRLKSFKLLVQAIKHLRAESYDWVIDFQGLLKSAGVAGFARINPQAEKIGLAHCTEGSAFENISRCFMTRVIDMPLRVHAVERARLLLAKIVDQDTQYVALPLQFSLNSQPLHKRLTDLNITHHPYVIAIHAASQPSKYWKHWRDLFAEFSELPMQFLLPQADASERKQAEHLSQGFNHVHILPKLALTELYDLMGSALAIMGLDSGLTHLACCLQRPTLALYNTRSSWRTASYWQMSHTALEYPRYEQVRDWLRFYCQNMKHLTSSNGLN